MFKKSRFYFQQLIQYKIQSKERIQQYFITSYYYVWSIQKKSFVQGVQKLTYQLVKLHQLKCPSFKNNVLLWTDDTPQNNIHYIQQIKQKNLKGDVIQLRSTETTVAWKNLFGQIVKDNNLKLKIISDMVRIEENQTNTPNYLAGLELVQIFRQKFHYNDKILIFCGDQERGSQNAKKKKLYQEKHNFQITQQQDKMINYCQQFNNEEVQNQIVKNENVPVQGDLSTSFQYLE